MNHPIVIVLAVVGALAALRFACRIAASPLRRAYRRATIHVRLRRPVAPDAAIASRWAALGQHERALVIAIADRLLLGAVQYGPLPEPVVDPRDFHREAREEAIDDLIYRAIDAMRRERRGEAEPSVPSSRPRGTWPPPPAAPAAPAAVAPAPATRREGCTSFDDLARSALEAARAAELDDDAAATRGLHRPTVTEIDPNGATYYDARPTRAEVRA